jgi:hypothetical protein
VSNDSEQSFWVKLWHSPGVSLSIGLISAIGTYFQYQQAGRTLWFWILCVVAIIAGLIAAVPPVVKWRQERKRREAAQRLYYDHQQKVETLTRLTDEFVALEKARCLADALTGRGNVRVVAILPVEEGRIGVMLNIGRKENLQAGTPLLVHRVDHYTSHGQRIESRLGLVQVTYVQAENNCSQAIVLDRSDREFWDQATTRLKREKSIDPPRNRVVPYIPPELRGLSLEDLTTIRQHLQAICVSLTGEIVQRRQEGMQ